MGTRGAIGVRIDQADRVFYNHFDSYPDGLGIGFFKDAVAMVAKEQEYQAKARALELVNENDEPSPEHRAKYGAHSDPRVNQGKGYYSLLRDLRGELKKVLDLGLGCIAPPTWLADSLFCEYAYILNFDERVAEFYRGFNTSPNGAGRYAALNDGENARRKAHDMSEYFGVVLVGTIPFDDLAKFTDGKAMSAKLEALYREDEEQEAA